MERAGQEKEQLARVHGNKWEQNIMSRVSEDAMMKPNLLFASLNES